MDDFRLEQIGELHALSAEVFVPFVIYRLRRASGPCESLLQVELRGIPGQADGVRALRLYWEEASIPVLPPGVPEPTVTEWAALGVAAAVVWQYGEARLSSVSMRGDRFDYWVLRDGVRYGLEVSGTTTEQLADRHRDKVTQLLANPFAAAGFVVVVGFASGRVIFSHHSTSGVSP